MVTPGSGTAEKVTAFIWLNWLSRLAWLPDVTATTVDRGINCPEPVLT